MFELVSKWNLPVVLEQSPLVECCATPTPQRTSSQACAGTGGALSRPRSRRSTAHPLCSSINTAVPSCTEKKSLTLLYSWLARPQSSLETFTYWQSEILPADFSQKTDAHPDFHPNWAIIQMIKIVCFILSSRRGKMSKIVSVHSFRAGTGKSNTTANLASLLAVEGARRRCRGHGYSIARHSHPFQPR